MDFDSHFLAPSISKQPRKPSSRPALGNTGRSSTMGASLAHELAAAVMSEPSDSRALADELGLEFEDEDEEDGSGMLEGNSPDTRLSRGELSGIMGTKNHSEIDTPSRPSRGDKLNGHGHLHHYDMDSDFDSSPTKPPPPPSFALATSTIDPIDTLKENVHFLDRFITQLKHIDIDPTSPTKPSLVPATASHVRRISIHASTEPAVERIATDMIRHIDDARREREDQLRDLVNFEREFRKIDGEPGGADRLGSLEPLEDVSLTDKPASQTAYSRTLDIVPEDEYDETWDAQRDPRDVFDDGDEETEDGDDPMFVQRSPRRMKTRSLLPAPPPYPSDPLTPSSTLPHLAHMRAVSQVLAASLSGLSEHVQVNGAAAAEAGRKLRALKNKIGDLQAEWTSAEESMVKIERSEKRLDWEKVKGEVVGEGKRVDGRVLVKEISASFFAQLEQVELKVQAMFPTIS